MSVARSNALLPVLAGLVVLITVFVAVQAFTTPDEDDAVVLREVPRAEAPDADSPTETIRTLTARVADLTNETRALRGDNEALQRRSERLLGERRDIEQVIDRKVRQQSEAQAAARRAGAKASDGALSAITQRVDALSSLVRHYGPEQAAPELPVGLGLDAAERGALVWHDPLDAPAVDLVTGKKGGLLKTTAPAPLPLDPRSAASDPQALASPRPVYTVPENATLTGATAFTALVGRIPVRGRVQDPWPFKVITGADNLTANGLTLPEVAGMVWSGIAVGDWTLACVRGWVTSVTFIFRDGSLRTHTSGESGDLRGVINDGVVSDHALGWISDRFGAPCLSGRRITNAPQFLAQRTALLAARAAAEAAASAQTTSIVSGSQGTITQSVDDSSPYILGKTVSGGVEEINQWLLERQQQTFDAVFARAGAEVAIHVTRALPIDYDPTGRKLRHAHALPRPARTRLD